MALVVPVEFNGKIIMTHPSRAHWHTERRNRIALRKKNPNVFDKFMRYCWRAWENGWQFYLTIKDFEALDLMRCRYCGGIPSGYDRLDSKIGYIRTNIVPCCIVCNMMKHARSHKDFMAHIKKMYKWSYKG